ncbi:YidB family protein [Embleya sp. NBC_00888]|uniref:YidB family protein n=1 Tax=Embleya sp. NBC_00888 TaxID=2975960 RepID=UPI00386D6737|nr:YidB family protein [Embleya sp. NBC_00888]
MSGGGMGVPGGLDGLLGGLLGGRGGSGHQGLVRVVLGMLTKQGDSGGLGALMQRLQAGGLADQAKSWVETGRNQPVSGKEITDALGEDEMVRLAGEAGMTKEETAAALAATLPGVVDAVTPEGELPAVEQIDALIDPAAASAGSEPVSAPVSVSGEAAEGEAGSEDESAGERESGDEPGVESESGAEAEAESGSESKSAAEPGSASDAEADAAPDAESESGADSGASEESGSGAEPGSAVKPGKPV